MTTDTTECGLERQICVALTGSPCDLPQHRFPARRQGEISNRGVIDMLRHGIKHRAHNLDFFYGTPSAVNEKAHILFDANRFSITWQLLADTEINGVGQRYPIRHLAGSNTSNSIAWPAHKLIGLLEEQKQVIVHRAFTHGLNPDCSS